MRTLFLCTVLFFVMSASCFAQAWRYADNHPYKRQVRVPPRAQTHYAPRVQIQVTPYYRYRTPGVQLYFGPHYNTRPYLITPRPYYGNYFHFCY